MTFQPIPMMPQPLDFLGNDIEPGAFVVYPASWGSSTTMVLAQVKAVVERASRRGGGGAAVWTLRVNRYAESLRNKAKLMSPEERQRVITVQQVGKVVVVARPGEPIPKLAW